MKQKKKVIIGILGKVEDQSANDEERWNKWRPTVDLCRHENLAVSRYELLYQPKDRKLAEFVAKDIKLISPKTFVNLYEIKFKNPFNLEEVFNSLYDFADTYKFIPDEEDYLVNISTGTHIMKICLFLLTEAKYFPANLIQSPKPNADRTAKAKSHIEPYIEIDLRLEKHKKIAQRVKKRKQDDILFLKDYIDTKNPVFESLMKDILYVSSNSNSPILLTGKTGVGKSSLARRIHENRKKNFKNSGDFISVNCATLRGDTVVSTLFGHEKGSFTGASDKSEGFLKKADGGTLFLDEIGDLNLDVQAMLLKAIEEKSFWSVGGKKPIESDFYLIAGTNSDLNRKVREGLFRRDLLARINIFHFEMPELKDRPEDIEPNLNHELEKFKDKITMSAEAKLKYLSFAKLPTSLWNGNFRELNASVIRMATFSEDTVITKAVVEKEIETLKNKWNQPNDNYFPFLEAVLTFSEIENIDTFFHAQLNEVIRVCFESHSRSEAGRKLYNVTRNNKKSTNDADRLNKYLQAFNIDWETIKDSLKNYLPS